MPFCRIELGTYTSILEYRILNIDWNVSEMCIYSEKMHMVDVIRLRNWNKYNSAILIFVATARILVINILGSLNLANTFSNLPISIAKIVLKGTPNNSKNTSGI